MNYYREMWCDIMNYDRLRLNVSRDLLEEDESTFKYIRKRWVMWCIVSGHLLTNNIVLSLIYHTTNIGKTGSATISLYFCTIAGRRPIT